MYNNNNGLNYLYSGSGMISPILPERTCASGLDLYLPYLLQQEGNAELVTEIDCDGIDTGSSIPTTIGLYTYLTNLK